LTSLLWYEIRGNYLIFIYIVGKDSSDGKCF
jgi:hypothetical protein